MNERQKYALDHHCRFAFETANRAFGWACEGDSDGGTYSVVLTVNSGWE